eukprot:2339611-Ditylum_brightwellii.AAC.1
MIVQRALNQECILRNSERIHVYLHMKYHPANTPHISSNKPGGRKWATPSLDALLHPSENCMGFLIDIGRMVVAYSRPLNIDDILYYRKVDAHIDPPA